MKNNNNAREIGKVKIPFNIDFFTIAAASKLLENRNKIEKVIAEIVKERDDLIMAMSEVDDVTVYPSHANFILFKIPYDPNVVFNKILDDGILIRNLSANPLLANTLRVTVSKPSDNKQFLDSLTRAMTELAKEK